MVAGSFPGSDRRLAQCDGLWHFCVEERSKLFGPALETENYRGGYGAGSGIRTDNTKINGPTEP